MNPVLVDAIRVRMREQTTEQLLELWTTNDRAMWSPEAFEAVKSLLAERGVKELPPQSDPAPVADRHRPSDVPDNVYWMGWLRPVLWIGIVVSCLTLFYQGVAAWETRREWSSSWLDERWEVLVTSMLYILLPALLIAGSVACFRFVRWSRAALLTYAWVTIAFQVLDFLSQVRPIAWVDFGVVLAGHAVTCAHQLVFPLVLLGLLRRPEIRDLFSVARPGSGFDPALSGKAPDAGRLP